MKHLQMASTKDNNPTQINKMNKLELKLSDLAYEWRSLHIGGQLQEAAQVVQAYHVVMDELWSLGWNGKGLSVDAQLPDELMPASFVFLTGSEETA